MIKALAVDIDGTLTDSRRRINCKAVEALRKLKIPVVLATGNTLCFARTAAKLIGLNIVIAENGGVVSFDDEHEVFGDKQKCIKALEVLKKHFEIHLLDFDLRKSEVCVKRTFDAEIAKKFIQGMGVKILDSGFAYHISDEMVGKGKALHFIAGKIGIDLKDFAVIGDSLNDLDMFEVAGIKIAVANAHIELKKRADVVTPSPDGDGVVEALKILNLL
ncbi:MAG: phosphoglycolate phosphatase [Archaeoglobaceae archaeon]|nr:phosphoglycolate phosphatase [Archaeoglobaceae archaeon]MCX8152261.1 phosphoglycolate phosphatase [Archaeoglobaceae archaeon]MDW8013939.1 phosphoglycolate phosphatase [Archaeoglobaceae archaeon]